MLVGLPLWLVVSSLIGLWIWWRGEQAGGGEEPVKYATPVSEQALAADLDKLLRFAPRRDIGDESGRMGLSRASAMIQGTLGPGNAGYRIDLWPAAATPEGEWPIVVATLPGDDRDPLWVVAGYDTGDANPMAANTAGVVALLGVAGDLAGEALGRPVKFAFLPHVYDPRAPVPETLSSFVARAQAAGPVLVVECLDGGEPLRISSRDLEVLDDPAIQQAGEIVGAEVVCLQDDIDPASVLFESGVSAVRVATRVSAAESSGERPDPGQLAGATSRVAAMLRALAR